MASFGETVVLAALERLQKLFGIDTDTATAELCGVSKQTFSKWKSRGTLDIAKIKESIPELSIDWLLTGDGKPLIKTINKYNSPTNIKRSVQNMATQPLRDVMRYVNQPIEEYLSEPTEEYKTANEHRNRIPIVGGRVSAGKPLDVFDSITGYFYTDSIATNSTCILQMFVDTYKEHGIRKGDMLVIDTKATPKDCSYIVFADAERYKVGHFRIDKDVTKYIDLESGKDVIVNKENLGYIIGVIKTRIRDY